MKNRTRICYRIEIEDICGNDDMYRIFRSFRAGKNFLLKVNEEFVTLRRIAYKPTGSPHDLYSGTTLACWMVNKKGKIVRFERRWLALWRKRDRAAARAKRVTLTHNGQPYTLPPRTEEPTDIPF